MHRKMARSSFRHKIRALEDRRAELVRKAAGLVQTQQRLMMHNAVLSAWCETLTLLQVQWGGSGVKAETASQEEEDEGVRERFEELLNNELRLLNELTARGSASSCSSSSCGTAAVLLDPGPEAISPGDPMRYLMAAVAECPKLEVANLTCDDAARMLREAVLINSVELNQGHLRHEWRDFPASAKQLWDRYVHAVLSLIMHGREDVTEGLLCFNLQSMTSAPENAAASYRVCATLPPRLDLTDVQKDIIAVGAEVCASLLAALKQQRDEVLVAMKAQHPTVAAAAAAAAVPSCSISIYGVGQDRSVARSSNVRNTASAAVGACSPNSSSIDGAVLNTHTVGQLNHLGSRQQHIKMQQQLAARLKLLLAKEYVLILVMAGLMVGCLSYRQLSLASALSWPYSIPMYHLALEVQKMRLRELEVLQ